MFPLHLIVNVLSSVYSWVNSNPTVALAIATTFSVGISIISVTASILLSKKSIDKNNDLVEANKEAVEETRKDHRRESIKDLIVRLDEIKKKIPNARSILHRTTDGPYAVGRSFVELDEWDLEIPNHLRALIREETTSESVNILSEYREYKKDYKKYNREISSLQSSISRFLKNRYLEIDWPEEDPKQVNKHLSGNPLSVKEAKQKIQNNHDEIAERIVEEGMVFSDRQNKILSKIVYDTVKEQYSDEFEYLRNEPSELQSKYDELAGSRNIRPSTFDRFIRFLRRKYEIPQTEINKKSEENEDKNNKTKQVLGDVLEGQTISVKSESNPIISGGEIYINHMEYDKTEEDIDRDDYESLEYQSVVDEETPGIPYDSIEVLPSGWVKCINSTRNLYEVEHRNQDEDRIHHTIDLYPPQVVEKIQYFTVTVEKYE